MLTPEWKNSSSIRGKTALLGMLLVAAGQALAADKQKTLSVDGQNNHNWPATTPLIKLALEESGQFTVEVATSPAGDKDLSAFAPKFSDYQVVVSNYEQNRSQRPLSKDLGKWDNDPAD